jgi:hypothetical protein
VPRRQFSDACSEVALAFADLSNLEPEASQNAADTELNIAQFSQQ